MELLYELRLKGRQKQGECSVILTMTFMIILLSMFSVNLIPLVYVSAVKPFLDSEINNKVALAVSTVVLVTLWFVMSCLSYGSDRFMLKRAEDKTAGAGDIFYYFAPKKALGLIWFLMKFTSLKLLLFSLLSLPFCLCAGICCLLSAEGFSAAVCSIFAVFSLVFISLAVAAYLKISDSFFLVRYRYIKGEYLNFRHLLSQSQQDMLGKTKKLRLLKASFSGWFLLSLLIIPLPYVWCYYRQTKACFANE